MSSVPSAPSKGVPSMQRVLNAKIPLLISGIAISIAFVVLQFALGYDVMQHPLTVLGVCFIVAVAIASFTDLKRKGK